MHHSGTRKASRFITKVELSEVDILLLYGGIAGRFIEVPGSYRSEALNLLKKPNSDENRNSTLYTLFHEQGFIIPEQFDELGFLKRRYNVARQIRSKHLGLTICPTLNCNFTCSYCYQRHTKSMMTENVQEKIIHFIEKQEPPVTNLSVTWFGGEPLLAISVIQALSRRLMNLNDRKIEYKGSIITNGYLLTPTVSNLLAELKVTDVQVTLDGPRNVHNVRRSRNGRPTFDKIIRNIALCDPRIRIGIRINIDQNNRDNIPELFDQLDSAGLQGRISIYFAPVAPYTDVCTDTAGACIDKYVWSKIESQLQLIALNRGYGGIDLPKTKTHICMADNKKAWAIRPDGLVHKCWADVAQSQCAVFNLLTGEQTQTMKKVLNRWESWNPFDLEECLKCKILPQCMGGCPYLGLRQEDKPLHGHCMELKDNLPATIATYYLAYKQREATNELSRKLHEWIPNVIPDIASSEGTRIEDDDY